MSFSRAMVKVCLHTLATLAAAAALSGGWALFSQSFFPSPAAKLSPWDCARIAGLSAAIQCAVFFFPCLLVHVLIKDIPDRRRVLSSLSVVLLAPAFSQLGENVIVAILFFGIPLLAPLWMVGGPDQTPRPAACPTPASVAPHLRNEQAGKDQDLLRRLSAK